MLLLLFIVFPINVPNAKVEVFSNKLLKFFHAIFLDFVKL